MGNILKKQTELWNITVDDEKIVFHKSGSYVCKVIKLKDFSNDEVEFIKANPNKLIKLI
jgi:hypothetical protein